jgi:hypothetical protein
VASKTTKDLAHSNEVLAPNLWLEKKVNEHTGATKCQTGLPFDHTVMLLFLIPARGFVVDHPPRSQVKFELITTLSSIAASKSWAQNICNCIRKIFVHNNHEYLDSLSIWLPMAVVSFDAN